ncbi:hypothetical protein PS623_02841 [Pseudomonas fluorescens]|uniref:hypothetical protein n=1 Tax=Pseudomonas fluorescens TaxID=294 RepID=UPI001240BF19|nr:hypothetical protein [Pseudomonas fluorescens]VVM92119.1 hypothetical protein PS623_02841 [Pseudomonas fluorescens]
MTAPRTVLVLAFPGALLLNAAGPLEVFAAAPRVLAGELASNPPYRVVLASPAGGEVETISGIGVMTRSLQEVEAEAVLDTLIVIGGLSAPPLVPAAATTALPHSRRPLLPPVWPRCNRLFPFVLSALAAVRSHATTDRVACTHLRPSFSWSSATTVL